MKPLYSPTSKNTQEGGFIRAVVVIVFAIVLLKYVFNFDLLSIFNNPIFDPFFNKVFDIWNRYLYPYVEPITSVIWHYAVIGYHVSLNYVQTALKK